jgi:hypothetical protein
MITDPRTWPDAAAAPEHAGRLHALAAASLGAAVAHESDRRDAEIVSAFRSLIDAQDGARLAEVLASAPSSSIHRHLWRQLVRAEAAIEPAEIALTVFALPLVIVAGVEDPVPGAASLPGTLPDIGAVVALLREHGALRSNRTFALADALCGSSALEVARLPVLLAWRSLPQSFGQRAACDLPPAPLELGTGDPRVHLRFLVGTALAAPGVDLLGDPAVGKWGMALTRELSRQLAPPGTSVLALPQAPQRLAPALAQGRARQREVSAQLFASGALRRLRGAVGEPAAVISAHVAPHEPGGGELRVSLSSAFDPRAAEGFRCPLYALDRVDDVVEMLVALLRDCRVADVRVLPGVHADRDPATGLPLLVKADALPEPRRH